MAAVDASAVGASAESDAAIPPNTCVGDYRIRGLIGEGAMSQVYLAQDIKLGRRIALKIIKRRVMDADGLARFLDEARTTAGFNHPNIVTLHTVGEYEGRPFLALEYVDGESLRERIASGPIALRDALRIARALAEAISEAHARNLVHADLKPENILISREGRVRVVDFGLAKLIGTAPAASSGTPAYMAPERWRHEAPTAAIDVWAFGMILHELVVGRRPISDAALVRLPYATTEPELEADRGQGWGAVVVDCLALDPKRRPTAPELVRRIAAIVDPRATSPASCPFPGLAAFSREDAAQYFGRVGELDEVVERLRATPLVPIVGPSGIGKSSFVNAALIPRLEEGAWTVLSLRPGAAPFDRIANAIGARGEASSLPQAPDRLALLLATFASRVKGRLVVYLDQFEEVFTLAPQDSVAFCECIARAASSDDSWRIVLTVRDDFLGRLAESPQMRRHLGAVMSLAPLSRADLHTAVTSPLANAELEPDDPDLVNRIVADVHGQAACLPLLQFACQTLWERRDVVNKRVLAEEYTAMGGASGALAIHADRFITELLPEQVGIARSLLLALLDPDGTRRPRLRSELEAKIRDAGPVIDRLLSRRLVIASREVERGDDARLDVAHESLATVWPRLKKWLDETHDDRLLELEIEQAAMQWQRRGKRDDLTWSGTALADAIRRTKEWGVPLPAVSLSFLAASQRRERRLRHRRRWVVTSVIALLAVATVIAVVVAIAFARKTREAERAAIDLGVFQLELEPFDWNAKENRPSSPSSMPLLTWTLHFVDETDPRLPGARYGERDLRRSESHWSDGRLIEQVEARSGQAFILVNRGDCAPSELFLRRLPSYIERDSKRVVRLRIPTCAASREGMVDVPAGPFFERVSRKDLMRELPAFRIDRTEVTRAAFAAFSSMEQLTGVAALPVTHLELPVSTLEQTPIVGVNYYTASSYCRFLGKRLPSLAQWQKAFRGGLEVDGQPNPNPRREVPWMTTTTTRPANVDVDGTTDMSPVGSFPDDTSPYGVVDLLGNVSEWTSSTASDPGVSGLRVVAGSNWGEPVTLQHDTIEWSNTRPDGFLDYGIGIRCVD